MKKIICTVMILVAMMNSTFATEGTISPRSITRNVVNGFGNIHSEESYVHAGSTHTFTYIIKAFGMDFYTESYGYSGF